MGPKVTNLFVLAVAVVCVLLRLSELPLENLSLLGALAVFCGARVRPVWLAVKQHHKGKTCAFAPLRSEPPRPADKYKAPAHCTPQT